MSISGHTSSYNHIRAPICSYLQMLLHCPFFLLRIYEFSNLAFDTQTWSFTWAKEIFILTPHMVSRWYLLLPAEPALLAEGAHSCKAGSRLVNIQGPASLHSCIWAPNPLQGCSWKPRLYTLPRLAGLSSEKQAYHWHFTRRESRFTFFPPIHMSCS